MNDFTPFLQIIHISDLHVSDPRSQNAVVVRGLIRKLRKFLPQSLVNEIEDGLLPHNPRAVGLLKEFINRVANKDPIWSKCKTWLVDTGDLTTLGDCDSLDLGRKYLEDLGKVCTESASIYGNHDAWPGTLPLFAGSPAFATQTKALMSRSFSVATPTLALRTPIPHGTGEVQLYFVDSINHGRIANTAARGEVQKSQLQSLLQLVDQNYSATRCDFRILAVHHPVHYPPRRPRGYMSMSNDSDVARTLSGTSSGGAYPLAHLVLSGHTHKLFPKHGELPLEPYLCVHPDLGNDQCQLVVGSLMQIVDRYNKRKKWPHQCEVLRLYYSPDDPSVLVMERLLAARREGRNHRGTGIGPYEFVVMEDGKTIEEAITFTMY